MPPIDSISLSMGVKLCGSLGAGEMDGAMAGGGRGLICYALMMRTSP